MADDGMNRPSAGTLLKGWREIAGYFNRDISTVRRWAAEGALPVHRPRGGAARRGTPVYAYSDELEAWLRGRPNQSPPAAISEDGASAGDAPAPALLPAAAQPAAGRKTASRRRAVGAGLGLVLAAVAGAFLWRGLSLPGWGTTGAGAAISEEAQDLFNRALFHLNLRTSDGINRAMTLFREALVLEPAFVDAEAGLAQSYNLAAQYNILPREEAYPLALATARKALSQDPDHPAGLAAQAFATFYWLREFPAAYALFERALRRDPANAEVHHWYALAVMHDRRFDIALREIEAAQRLLPTSPSVLANKALILHHAGRTAEALGILEPLARNQPQLLSAASYLATIYLDTGRDADFAGAFRQAAQLLGAPGQLAIADAVDRGLARGGRAGMLRAMLEAQERLFAEGQMPAFKLAVTAAYLEQTERTLDYLESAIERNEPQLLGIKLELPLRVLRGSPRYRQLIAQVGLSTL